MTDHTVPDVAELDRLRRTSRRNTAKQWIASIRPTIRVRWPSVCPVCGSRKVYVYQQTGEWFCASCNVDSTDVTEAEQLNTPPNLSPPPLEKRPGVHETDHGS